MAQFIRKSTFHVSVICLYDYAWTIRVYGLYLKCFKNTSENSKSSKSAQKYKKQSITYNVDILFIENSAQKFWINIKVEIYDQEIHRWSIVDTTNKRILLNLLMVNRIFALYTKFLHDFILIGCKDAIQFLFSMRPFKTAGFKKSSIYLNNLQLPNIY